jgi:hypothetical protein
MELNTTFPRQKISYKDKDQTWKEDCVKAVISMTMLQSNRRRSTNANKQRNYNLYNGVIDEADFKHVTNPYNLNNMTMPATLQPYDIVSPIFNLLLGEETKRYFNPIVRAVNDDVTSEKDKVQKQMIMELYTKLIQQHLQDEPQQQDPNDKSPQTPEEVAKYMKYQYKDVRESVASHILTYLRKYLRLDQVFQEGWKDALVAGEEIYEVVEISNEPRVLHHNPLEVRFVLPTNTDIIDEADMICVESSKSVSEIIDMHYEDLTPDQIDELEANYGIGSYSGLPILNTNFAESVNSSVRAATTDYLPTSIKLHRVTWKSKKKIGRLTFMDRETGEEQQTIVDETFKIPKGMEGMDLEWFWINEYWEGGRIGNDIYLPIKPKKCQFRSMDNLSSCKSGFVGTVYNATNATSVSLMDRIAPWLYLYLVTWYRTELVIAANQGKIAMIDLSLIPDGWEIEKWMYYATSMKFGFVDSFNESKKGESIGKIAGNLASQNKVLDLETGNSIQHNISLLSFIEEKISQVSGVTPQRMGAISSTELVGNAERSVVQSSTITEKWFDVHNYTKLRVMEAMIEVAKHCWDGKSKKIQYVTDDMATIFLQVDGNEFNNADYGVFITNSNKDLQALEALKSLTQAALQNDKISMSAIIDIYTSESIADTKAAIRRAEEELQQNQQQTQQAKQDHEKQIHDELLAQEQAKMDREDYNKEQDRQVKIQVAEIASFNRVPDQDTAGTGTPDQVEIATHDLKERELAAKERIEYLKIANTQEQNRSQERIANKQAELKQKEIDSRKEIAKIKVVKPKTK